MTKLSNRALLANLSTSQWMGRKMDRKVTDEIAKMHGTNSTVGNYHKSLLPNCMELKAVHQKTAEVRKQFYRYTLPWGIEGTYILPSGAYLDFMTYFRQEKNEWERLLNNFLSIYGPAIEQAERDLNGMFNSSQYPHPDEMPNKFRMDMSIMPVPEAGDFRVEMIDAERDALAQEIEAKVADAHQASIKEVWQRLFDKVQWIGDKLHDLNKTFHTETYDDARQTIELLRKLNINDDADLTAMIDQAQEKIFSNHPDTLRYDPEVRQQAADDASDIMAKMGAFMGGVKA